MSNEQLFGQFRSAVAGYRPGGENYAPLLIAQSGTFRTCYSPFEYINPVARVVFVGITPGRQQAANALARAQAGLADGESEMQILRAAKEFASFSGAMRTNLVDCLDAIGVNRWLGIESTATLFDGHAELAHFTSVLRYPTFVDNENYSGKPEILKTPFLMNQVDRWFATELGLVPGAIWVPLGPTPTAILESLSQRGMLDRARILAGLPHPSGANAERISYFLGRKLAKDLSAKTHAAQLDLHKERLLRQVAALRGPSTHSPIVSREATTQRKQTVPSAPSMVAGELQASAPIDTRPATHDPIEVPIAKDGSWFGPHLERRSGFTIGEKGEEMLVTNFLEAVRLLSKMRSPCWRRPNANGNWGIVTGIRWALPTETGLRP